jgi:DNA-directed RNA polymerase subunit RPC12/RpoP
MRVKCNCNNCSAQLEFESEDAGRVIDCPTCGIETKLFVAGSASSLPPTNLQQMKNRRLKFGIIAAGSLMLVGLVSLLIINWDKIIPPLSKVFGGTIVAVFMAILAVLAIIWAVLWIVFPVFVYYQLNELIKLQRQIERNTRR